MAHDTKETIFDLNIYEVFPRMYGMSGNAFKKISEALPALKELGINTVWLMPVHPVGKKNKKGFYGSPYAIRDFFEIDGSLGTKHDFLEMVKYAHSLGMKVFMDMVMNHCACDAAFACKNPAWLLKDHNNRFARKVEDWSDVYDLNYANHDLVNYMIEVLKYWVREFDIDGYRCDVADLVPIAFWMRARHEISMIKSGFFWLSEGHGDEMYQAFDMTYDYDGFTQFLLYLDGKVSLEYYVKYIEYQNSRIPSNAAKLRFIENHDQQRFAERVEDPVLLKNWTAFFITLRGVPLLYNGQEYRALEKPDIFGTPSPEPPQNSEFRDFVATLLSFRRRSRVMRYGSMSIHIDSKRNTLVIIRRLGKHEVIAGMNFSGRDQEVLFDVDAGASSHVHFFEHISNTPYHLRVSNSKIRILLDSKPIILSRVLYG